MHLYTMTAVLYLILCPRQNTVIPLGMEKTRMVRLPVGE